LRAGALTAVNGPNNFSNRCATTDGYNPIVCAGSAAKIGRDVWYEYIATQTGVATFSMCDNVGWDGIMAIHGTASATCPATASAANLLACNDEQCVESGGPPEINLGVTAGRCYLLRIGGWLASDETDLSLAEQGAGTLNISYGGGCPDPVPAPAVAVTPKRVRHLGFNVPSTSSNSLRVKLTASTQFPLSVGKSWYVGAPREVTETSGSGGPGLAPRYWVAALQADPLAANWSTYPSLYVYGAEIAPNSTYEVGVVPANCELYETAYANISIESARWGDVVGDCYPSNSPNCVVLPNGYRDCCSAPQGTVNFTDISAVVDKFGNKVGAVTKARADVAGGGGCNVNQVIDFVDIPGVVDAFRGIAYPNCPP
jgi:hypothetical protein